MSTAAVFVVSTGVLGTPERPASEVLLDGAEGHHAADVRRVRPAERIDVVDGAGARARCVVAAVERGRVTLLVESVTVEPTPAPRLVVVQALAKGDRGERAVELLTEVGADEIVPWAASRSVVQWHGERGAKALQRWRATAREAAKQSRRAAFPEVTPPATTAQVADRLRAAAGAAVLMAGSDRSLATVPLPDAGDLVLVVGPEGDLTDSELAAFDAAGACRAALGSTVLRTSTAGAVGAAIALSRLRW